MATKIGKVRETRAFFMKFCKKCDIIGYILNMEGIRYGKVVKRKKVKIW